MTRAKEHVDAEGPRPPDRPKVESGSANHAATEGGVHGAVPAAERQRGGTDDTTGEGQYRGAGGGAGGGGSQTGSGLAGTKDVRDALGEGLSRGGTEPGPQRGSTREGESGGPGSNEGSGKNRKAGH